MNDSQDPTLILHGYGGNKPEHWQEWLASALRSAGAPVYYPQMPDPSNPRLDDWLERIEVELDAIPDRSRLAVATHSLGAISWMHLATRRDGLLADRVLLVAPPYISPDQPDSDSWRLFSGFYPPPTDPARIAAAASLTALVASDDDDLATWPQSEEYAHRMGIPAYLMPGAGHISPYYGYGSWPWVFDWCLRNVELPPQPRPAG